MTVTPTLHPETLKAEYGGANIFPKRIAATRLNNALTNPCPPGVPRLGSLSCQRLLRRI